MGKKTLRQMSTRTKVLVAVAAALQLALFGVAYADISRRDPSQIRGSKAKWRAITLINFVGPAWYFLRGRLRPSSVRTADELPVRWY